MILSKTQAEYQQTLFLLSMHVLLQPKIIHFFSENNLTSVRWCFDIFNISVFKKVSIPYRKQYLI